MQGLFTPQNSLSRVRAFRIASRYQSSSGPDVLRTDNTISKLELPCGSLCDVGAPHQPHVRRPTSSGWSRFESIVTYRPGRCAQCWPRSMLPTGRRQPRTLPERTAHDECDVLPYLTQDECQLVMMCLACMAVLHDCPQRFPFVYSHFVQALSARAQIPPVHR